MRCKGVCEIIVLVERKQTNATEMGDCVMDFADSFAILPLVLHRLGGMVAALFRHLVGMP
jgi:hypothetical protein